MPIDQNVDGNIFNYKSYSCYWLQDYELNPYFSIFEQEEKRLKIFSLFKFLHNRSITNPSKIPKRNFVGVL